MDNIRSLRLKTKMSTFSFRLPSEDTKPTFVPGKPIFDFIPPKTTKQLFIAVNKQFNSTALYYFIAPQIYHVYRYILGRQETLDLDCNNCCGHVGYCTTEGCVPCFLRRIVEGKHSVHGKAIAELASHIPDMRLNEVCDWYFSVGKGDQQNDPLTDMNDWKVVPAHSNMWNTEEFGTEINLPFVPQDPMKHVTRIAESITNNDVGKILAESFQEGTTKPVQDVLAEKFRTLLISRIIRS